MPDAIGAMREAFAQLACGEVTLPTRTRIEASPGGAALVMPCHSAGQLLFSLKLATVFPGNPARGLPSIHSTVLLASGTTGATLAVIDGASLTAIRTGAASGLATDLLARQDASVAAVIGSGVQARTQLEAICCVRPIRMARVCSRKTDHARQFSQEMSARLGIPVVAAESPRDAVREADVVCTATSAASPVFDDGDLADGAHINAVGAFRPDMMEVPMDTVARARVVVDHRESAMEEAGDLLAPLRAGLVGRSIFDVELGDLLSGNAPGRTAPEQVTLFKSVGVAIQDLCAAATCLANARRMGLGTPLR
jgi:ornithine cyclodeaminase/alanine dehydrogenase-like protein (mu-crystallin family)